jgi:ATP-binding cassette subfamily B protein/ATP-binding cassette subfamily C protein
MSQPKASPKQYWTLFGEYLRPQRSWLLVLAVLILSGMGLRLVNPQVMRRFIDIATGSATWANTAGAPAAAGLERTALLFLGLAILQQIVSVGVAYLGKDVGWKATNALRVDLARHCLRLDMSFHNARTPGEMIERIDGDVNALSNFFSQFVIQMAGNALLLVGALILLFVTDWRAGAAIAVFALVALVVIARLQGFGASLWKAHREASADFFGFLEERLAGTEDIRSSGAKGYVMRRFYELLRTAHRTFVKAGAIGAGITHNTANVLFAIGSATALAVGAYLFLEKMVTIGTVYMILHYTTMLGWPIRQIARQMQDLQRAGASVVRVRELLYIESRVQDQPATAQAHLKAGGALEVVFDDVSFGYEPEKQALRQASAEPAEGDEETPPSAKEMVLHDLTFRLAPGTMLGLLGRTGSGKTTLSRLLFRLYDPDGGAVRLGRDGQGQLVDIRTLPRAELRRLVGLVTQDIQLFQASVRDNLTLFDPSIPDERIVQAIHDLGLGPWLESLPEGLDTELAAGGSGLSAGEAQLLALTRIFLRDPGVVVLDEASSRRVPATEQLIERAVGRLIQGRTTIVIAHRLGTVQRADQIMILEEGAICEHGARERLARDPASRFHGLLQTGLEEVLV